MPPPPPPSNDPKINTLLSTIQSERRNLEGAKAVMRAVEASSRNEAVIQQAQNEVRSAQASIKFLEDQLAQLQLASAAGGASGSPMRDPSSSSQNTPGSGYSPGMMTPLKGQQGTGSQMASPSPSRRGDLDRPLPPPPGAAPDGTGAAEGPKPAKNYTNLDLLRYDAPLTGPKITRMLNQLQFKLQVEEQYKLGIEKMAQAYRADGDKRLRGETDAKKVESDAKIQLLRKSKKYYENLARFGGAVEDDEDLMPDGKRKEALRKPIQGKLVISLRAARDLNHRAPSRKLSKSYTETTVAIKIEGNERAVSHPSRNDKWLETFDIDVERANEVEITIYDTIAPGDSAPIGIMWLRVSDLMEGLRRQKVDMESQGAGWVTADKAARMGPRQQSAPETSTLHSAGTLRGPHPATVPPGGEGIDGWWSVEPAGAISMRLDFVKDTVAGQRRPYDGIGRQGAVRKRKGDVFEMNGHQFVQRQFYQPIMCALCQEFLLTGEGYQCEDCRYACHKKCYPKVVTKCIGRANADGDGDEEKINHRIPHRFAPYTNMSANWCCHCGYMLPFGRKNSVRCSECGITCHQTCSHYVPDFCGMTMEMANILLKNLRDIKTTQTRKPISASSSVSTLPQYPAAPERPQQPPPQPQQVTQPPSVQPQRPMGYPEGLQPGSQAPSVPPGGYDPRQGPPGPPGRPVQGHQSRPSWDARDRPDGYQIPPVVPPVKRPSPGPGSASSQGPEPVAVAPTPQAPVRPPTQPPAQRPPPQQNVRQRRVGLDDFNFLAVLGKGNFGKVMLAEEKQSSNLYAIKVLKKEFIIENDEIESTQSEKRVYLTAAQERHPFLLGLHSCFQTETRVYFVMEYISGGDLMLHIQKKQFTLRQAKFYACEVLLALQYLHYKGIIYRDLKLDNILLTLDGHIKVADYGLCKEDMWYGKTTSTFCGTPEFMAPEILLEQRYGRAVDWWAFGVLTYEMLLGQSPFKGDDEDEIFDAILEDEPLYPITMPRDAVSLLQRLLTRDPTRRLGSGENDAEDIKRHLFFKDVNFEDVYHRRIPPPYFPTIGSATDTSNFDQEFTREQPTLTPVHTQLSAADQQEFAGFSWVAPWANNM
ncbi:hypothetical protein BD324DRAFT_602555 [Kockovaella imperatae]|uniref:protein kinase C n=1 Tax=Kockovaella imperatae TaxID=4999 RepID=A0A1Y1UD92_9TREE|nr:hypothetical protein BD324DRAFT_602555 [Kockovaella imperatae]ORX35993.1 hypothetical protein BD324DRAFT_602555 [Kockovaella imperatae]